MSHARAAKKTWTGRRAVSYDGYTNVQIENDPAEDDSIHVSFSRPWYSLRRPVHQLKRAWNLDYFNN